MKNSSLGHLMIRVIIYLILISSFKLIASETENFIIKEVKINLPSWKGNIYPIDFSNDTIYFINQNIVIDNNQYYFELLINTNGTDSLIDLKLPDNRRIDIVDLAVNDNYICLLDLQNVWVYDKNNYSFVKKIELPNTCINMSFNADNNNLLELSMCGFSSYNKDSLSQTYCCNFDFNTNKLNYFTFANPHDINFTYIRRKLESFSSSVFVVADASKYHLKVYNLETNDTTIIDLDKFESNIKYGASEEIIDPNMVKFIYYDLLASRDSLKLIELVNILSKDTICVIWSEPIDRVEFKRKYYMDIIVINQGKAEILYSSIDLNNIKLNNSENNFNFINARYKSGYFYKIGKKNNFNEDESQDSNYLTLFRLQFKM